VGLTSETSKYPLQCKRHFFGFQCLDYAAIKKRFFVHQRNAVRLLVLFFLCFFFQRLDIESF